MIYSAGPRILNRPFKSDGDKDSLWIMDKAARNMAGRPWSARQGVQYPGKSRRLHDFGGIHTVPSRDPLA